MLVLFVVFNTQTVDISLVFADVDAPLVLALLIAAVLGGLVVALLGRRDARPAPQPLTAVDRSGVCRPGGPQLPGAPSLWACRGSHLPVATRE